MNKTGPFYFQLIVGLLTVVACQQYAIYCQIGITYDSMDYLAAATSFREKGILLNQDGSLYLERTPLFPLLLAFLGENALQKSVYLQAFFLAAFCLIYFIMGKILIRQTVMRMLYFLSLVFGTSNLLISSFLWSEPLFVLLLGLHFYCLFHWILSKNRHFFLWLIVFAFLFCLQRFAGAFFVIATALSAYRMKVFDGKQGFFYLLFSLLGWMAWLAYWIIQKQSDFLTPLQTLNANVWEGPLIYLEVIGTWLAPLALPLGIRLFLATCLLALLSLFYFKKSQYKKWNAFEKIIAVNLFTYLIALILLKNLGFHEAERFMAVIYPLSFLLLFLAIEKLELNSLRKYLLYGCVVLWMAYPILRTLKNVQFWHQNNCKSAAGSKVKY